MSTNIDVRVTPALHEDSVTNLEGYSDETAIYVAPLREAFSDARVTLGKLHDARAAAAKNQAWTEAQQILLVAQEADKQQARLCKKFDGLRVSFEKQVASYDEQLSRPMREKAGMGSLNGEVRAHFKALSQEKRAKLLTEALEANDTDTLYAVLGAQPFLSGMMPAEHQHYTRLFHEKNNPELVRRLKVTRSALKAIEERAPLLFPQIEKAIGADRRKVREIELSNAAALTALKFGV
jgi:hypothetical protein